MPAAMHTQYLRACYVDNLLIRPGAFRIAGTAIDLSTIKQPMYVLGAENDHIAPWRGSYLTTQHVGGEVRYTLTSSGHVAGIVNPPGNPKAAFWTRPHADRGVDADAWREGAERVSGSWWDDWVAWAAERSGELVAPPRVPSGDPAPGSYAKGEDARPFKATSSARRSQRARTGAAAKRS
jgi:polyhydroxyalkanoate synthase